MDSVVLAGLAIDFRRDANGSVDSVGCTFSTDGLGDSARCNRAAAEVREVEGNKLDGPALVLREALPSGVYETRLYRYDGVIMEEYTLADAPYEPGKATPIVRSSVFDFSYRDGLLTIVTDAGEASVALRSAGGEQ